MSVTIASGRGKAAASSLAGSTPQSTSLRDEAAGLRNVKGAKKLYRRLGYDSSLTAEEWTVGVVDGRHRAAPGAATCGVSRNVGTCIWATQLSERAAG